MVKIRGAGTALKAGTPEVDIEIVNQSAESTDGQSREGNVELKSKPAGSHSSQGYTLKLRDTKEK